MRVLFVASEAVPFAKTGGLADVVGSLPKSLRARGLEVRLAIPCYKAVREFLRQSPHLPLHFFRAEIRVPIFGREEEGQVDETLLPGTDIPVYLIVRDRYFARDHFYNPPGGVYPDNAARFSFFCRGVIDMVERLGWVPDVVHCHDWQTGLIPLCLRFEEGHPPMATVFTIHNLAYRGLFPMDQLGYTGVIWNSEAFWTLEFWHQLSFMKAALVNADALTTVSPRYAQEIQTEAFGEGLEGVLRERAQDLFGILNGIDYEEWNPRTDPHIAAPFGPEDLTGKAQCRRALQRKVGLPLQRKHPLFGMVTRLADSKGLDLLAAVLPRLVETGSQVVILGTGEPGYHELLTRLAQEHPGQLSVTLDYDPVLAHQIYAGCDFFLIPSRFEPCGLTQMISMAYGTLPIVHAVGGLADTVREEEPQNGFVFHEYTPEAFWGALERAMEAYRDPDRLHQLRLNAFACDFSWDASAARYEEVYRYALNRRAQRRA